MKTGSPTSVACCTALLIVTMPGVALAASNSLLLDAEPQYASHLCWAAADVLAVNHFYPSCPVVTSTPTFATSQVLEAAYNELSPGNTLSHLLSYVCVVNIQACNYSGTPRLYGLTKNTGFVAGTPPTIGSNSGGLTWAAARQEIDAGRPFLFMWDYPDNNAVGLPVGKHQLVATGYSDERDSSGTQYLQIWDPWPVPMVLPSTVPVSCGPAPGVAATPEHSRWVPFSTYTSNWNEMALTVTPLHESDLWHLAVIAPPSPPSGFSVESVERPTPPSPPPPIPYYPELHPPPTPLPEMSFAKALGAALPQSRQLNLQVAGAAPRTLGVPFPIVGLGFTKLLSAADDPTVLLAGTTSAILFPVESLGEVVDAFLMLFKDGQWQVGGYANLEITQRLVAFRARYAAEKHLRVDRFYMVSVPGEVAFFAAYGKGKQAVLIPASTDPLMDAVAGKAVPADGQLRKLIKVIQRDLQRYSDSGRATVRPGG